MDLQDNVPLLFGHRHERLVSQNASVGDEDMNTPEFVQGSLYDRLTVLSRTYSSDGLATSCNCNESVTSILVINTDLSRLRQLQSWHPSH